jgi:hypothetical protein
VETAWEQLCTAAGRLDAWRTVLQRAVRAVQYYLRVFSLAVLEDRLNGRAEWPPVPDSGNSEIASTSTAVRAVDGGYLGQREQETLLAGDPAELGADARQHAIYLAAQMVTHFCGPAASAPAPALALTQAADRELVAQQDRAYEQARQRDLRRNPSVAEVTPTPVRDSADAEPSSEAMRQARLLRFGLVPR